MPYIGNTSPSRFVSNRAASVYSGDGSTVAFTLEQVVTQDEDVLVSVDGVVQEPSVAYAVSSGTTLTFTAAPSSNAGNNIFVYYLASQVGTVGHPSNQALSATSGTFSGAITGGGVLTTGGNVVIPDAGNIGSASDTDAMAISSGGVVTFSQTPVGIGATLTEQATTSGTTKDFTVPSTSKVIYVGLMGCSFSGSNDTWLMQLGTSGGIVTSGYISAATYTGGGSTVGGQAVTATNGLAFYYSAGAGGEVYGQIVITSMGSNKYTSHGHLASGSYISNYAGYASIGGALTTVRLTTSNGRTLDAGAVNVTYIE